MRSNSIVRKMISAISTVMFILALLLAVVFGASRLLGMKSLVITSGSMIPKYPVGSVIYVRPIASEQLSVGDDITFVLTGDSTATHRIREIDAENHQVYTYGINNKDSDGNPINDANPVDFDYIIGKVEFSLPVVGYLFILLGETGGKVFILCLLLVSFLLDRVVSQRKKQTNKRSAEG